MSEPSASPATEVYSAMTRRFGWGPERFARRFFSRFALQDKDVDQLRELEGRGAVVYVMRYSSRLDYLLFNWLFLMSGLRLSAGANGIRFYYYRPLGEALRLALSELAGWLRGRGPSGRDRLRAHLRELVDDGQSLFLFLRTDKIPSQLVPRRLALRSRRVGTDLLRELVDICCDGDKAVSLVPLALFWRKGPTPARSFVDLFYGGPERPRSLVKLVSFLFNYRSLAASVGTPIDLRAFVQRQAGSARERVVKQLRRSLLIFLRREEKPIVGPALRTFQRMHDAVLADPDVRDSIALVAAETRAAPARVRRRASRYLREIAANPSPTMLAVLAALARTIMRRLFTRFEVHGLDRVVEAAKLHPVVLAPSHRSHFDYVILSWLFYRRHLVPPHVAAGANLSFWPLGPMFRRGGAFFLRRSFDGDRLYTAVFRAYVQLLIKDGISQEFFIEGTRSRTGKTLQPRLGMLRVVLEAYARGARRELYIVPVGFTYERLVEERAMHEERRGRAKSRENFWGLIRARSLLRYRFGEVTVRFGEPLAVSQAIPRKPAAEPVDLRRVTRELGTEICRAINSQITAQGSAVAAAALLAGPGEALRRATFARRVEETCAMLELLGVPLSRSLRRRLEAKRPDSVAELLVRGDHVQMQSSARGDLLRVERAERDALDYYRAGITPAFVWPAALGLALREPASRGGPADRAQFWLDLLALEYFPSRGAAREATLEQLIQHECERAWLARARSDAEPAVTAEGECWQTYWIAQIRPVLEAYAALFDVALRCGGRGERDGWMEAADELRGERLALGEVRHPEGICSIAASNAIDWLIQRGILEPLQAATTPLRPGPRWPEFEPIAKRLAAALQSR